MISLKDGSLIVNMLMVDSDINKMISVFLQKELDRLGVGAIRFRAIGELAEFRRAFSELLNKPRNLVEKAFSASVDLLIATGKELTPPPEFKNRDSANPSNFWGRTVNLFAYLKKSFEFTDNHDKSITITRKISGSTGLPV